MINYQNVRTDNPINYDEVLERVGGDASFLGELLKLYFLEFEEKKAQIEEALGRADFGLIQEVGHSLKGASANLSLPALRRCAASLEAAGRDKNLEKAKETVALLLAECRFLNDFLRQNPPETQRL